MEFLATGIARGGGVFSNANTMTIVGLCYYPGGSAFTKFIEETVLYLTSS